MKSGWRRKALSDLVVVASGQVDPSEAPFADMPHIGGDNIESHTGRIVNVLTARQIGMISGKYAFTREDVLYSKIRPNLNKVATPDFEGICSADIYPLRPKPDAVCREFLVYLLRSDDFLGHAEKHSARTNIPKLNREALLAYEANVPPLSEQKRIAAILDKADALRRKRQQALQLTEQFLRSTFLDMFGDPVSNPKGWPMVPLGELSIIRRGGSPRPISNFLGGTVPWIKIGDGTKGDDIYIERTEEKIIEAGLSKTVLLQPGALIFANCGVSLGFARILKISGCIHDGWLSLDQIDSRIDKIFLLKMLNQITVHFQQIAPDGTQPNLNTGIVKAFKVPLPPLKAQQRFAAMVLKSNDARARLTAAKSHSERLFDCIVQRAFRGEL